MKYLTDYTQQAQTEMFNELGVFFAFSNEQFEEGLIKVRKNGILNKGEKLTRFSNLNGMFAPSKNAKEVVERLKKIQIEGRKKDIAENGKEKIIERELHNHECFYTGDITDAVDKVKNYGYTYDDVLKIYREKYQNVASS